MKKPTPPPQYSLVVVASHTPKREHYYILVDKFATVVQCLPLKCMNAPRQDASTPLGPTCNSYSPPPFLFLYTSNL